MWTRSQPHHFNKTDSRKQTIIESKTYLTGWELEPFYRIGLHFLHSNAVCSYWRGLQSLRVRSGREKHTFISAVLPEIMF